MVRRMCFGHDRIQSWIHTIDPDSSPNQESHVRPTKRIRLSSNADDSFAHACNASQNHALPNTPPTSETPSRKRHGEELDEFEPADVDATPRPIFKTLTTSVPVQLHASPSPSKRPRSRSTSPLKRTDLQMLEKPIYVKDLESNITRLPKDVEPLYSSLLPTCCREEIIPHEVREQVTDLISSRARAYSFRTADTPEATSIHTALCDVVMDAREAAELGYHEQSWNNFVHTSLLKALFASRQRLSWEDAPQQPRARVVSVMSATIVSDYIPLIVPNTPATINDEALASLSHGSPACSVSEPYSNSLFGSDAPKIVQSRSDSKKVDYTLALDLDNDTPLMKVMKFYLHNDALRRCLSTPHVNQTLYPPLSYSPIACSIETKLALPSRDPLLQLGIWVAAWHKRMDALRKFLISEASLLELDAPQRIPSTLLIEVVNHTWQLYFACDEGKSIVLYGPLTIGSTSNLVDSYMLHASLTTIREWIPTTFYTGMQQWLMCEELLDLIGG